MARSFDALKHVIYRIGNESMYMDFIVLITDERISIANCPEFEALSLSTTLDTPRKDNHELRSLAFNDVAQRPT